MELCLSTSYFLSSNQIQILENSGPICLAPMLVISEAALQLIKSRAISVALILNFATFS